MEAIETFLEILEDLMTENQMNVASLASKINLNKSAIHRWKQKSFFPQPSTVLKLTEIFQVSADYLFGRTENRDFLPSNLPETFWVRYSHLKKKQGLTDYMVSKHCKIRSGTISKWKHLNGLPETGTLLNLANYFTCSLDYLLGR